MIQRAAIISALSFVVVALLFLMMSRSLDLDAGWNDTSPEPTRFEFVGIGSCDAREQMELMASDRISSSKSCVSDDQCVLADFGCPFGCRVAVNALQLESARSAVLEYNQYSEAGECGQCFYRCAPASNPAALCIDGLCQFVDLGMPDFEDFRSRKSDT